MPLRLAYDDPLFAMDTTRIQDDEARTAVDNILAMIEVWQRDVVANINKELTGLISGNVDYLYPWVASGYDPNDVTFSGLDITIPTGSAVVGGQEFTLAQNKTISLTANNFHTIYVKEAGVITVDSDADYTQLPVRLTWAALFHFQTDATTLVGDSVFDHRTLRPSIRSVTEGGFNIEGFVDQMFIPTSVDAWASTTAYEYGDLVESSVDGKLYECFLAGTSSSSEPSGMPEDVGAFDADVNAYVITDGSTKWAYFGHKYYKGCFRRSPNAGMMWYFSNIGLLHMVDIASTKVLSHIEKQIEKYIRSWQATTAYVVGQMVTNDTAPGKLYICVTAGTSAGSGGPTGTGSGISDNTVSWDYVEEQIGNAAAWASSTAVAKSEYRTSDGWTWKAQAAGTTGATAPTTLAATGGFISDDTITWDMVAPTYSGGWVWYIKDTDRDLESYRYSDSNDSYAATLIRLIMAYLDYTQDWSWLTNTTPHGQSNLQFMKDIANECILDQVITYPAWAATTAYIFYDRVVSNGGLYICKVGGTSASTALSGTDYDALIVDGTAQWQYSGPIAQKLNSVFPGHYHGDGTSGRFEATFLMDNCESYSGLLRFEEYLVEVGDGDAGDYTTFLSDVSTGIVSMFDTSNNWWRWIETHKPSNQGAQWYPYCMAGIFPELHQIPISNNPIVTAFYYNSGWEYLNENQPSWWNRTIEAFPNLMLAYLAAKYRRDPLKAMTAVTKAFQHAIPVGSPISGLWLMSEIGYAIGAQRIITNSFLDSDLSPESAYVGRRVVVGGVEVVSGAVAPEDAIFAPEGSIFLRKQSNGDVGPWLYIKDSGGSDKTGWIAVPKNIWNAGGAPGVGDDQADGYTPGSMWVDIVGDDAYICVDDTNGAAVWDKITP